MVMKDPTTRRSRWEVICQAKHRNEGIINVLFSLFFPQGFRIRHLFRREQRRPGPRARNSRPRRKEGNAQTPIQRTQSRTTFFSWLRVKHRWRGKINHAHASFQIDPKVAFPRRAHPKVRKEAFRQTNNTFFRPKLCIVLFEHGARSRRDKLEAIVRMQSQLIVRTKKPIYLGNTEQSTTTMWEEGNGEWESEVILFLALSSSYYRESYQSGKKSTLMRENLEEGDPAR